MNEQIRKALAPLAQFWGNTSKTVKRLVIGGVIVAVIAALALSILLNSKDYVVIFDQLSDAETSEILAALQEMEVEVKVDGSGAIMVLAQDESRVRMQLATEGYPKSGLSYYLIEENSGMLTTDYERRQYMNMQLQERIAASIKTLEGVKDAVVTITVPEENVFYLQDKEKPTASVIIHMKDGSTLTENQILGIQNLVAKSVSGLLKENIALADSQGNDLIETSLGRSPDYAKIDITRQIENDIRKKVTEVLLGPYKGEEFTVSVTAAVDTDELVREETVYTPSPDGQNSGVISEETRSNESSTSNQTGGGVAGTDTNSEIPTYGETTGTTGESSSTSTNENIKYQVSQTKSQTQKSGATIESISIGIAIDKASFEPGERESVTQLVAYAAGVSPESITVQNFQFYKEEEAAPPSMPEGINKMVLYGGIAAGVVVLISLIALIVIMRRRKAEEEALAMASAESTHEALNALFGEAVEEVKPITPIQDVRREEVKQFARTNPEIAAAMIKSWLKSEDDRI
ncbi:MAG TPA: flagellar basal-body MS-ring/collar protein FliF [Anaerovoracaceae bacterium]|nr:flagellar basal-body MS-ring/collar protein FliF [Anaerovoracaceae bacterium]